MRKIYSNSVYKEIKEIKRIILWHRIFCMFLAVTALYMFSLVLFNYEQDYKAVLILFSVFILVYLAYNISRLTKEYKKIIRVYKSYFNTIDK